MIKRNKIDMAYLAIALLVGATIGASVALAASGDIIAFGPNGEFRVTSAGVITGDGSGLTSVTPANDSVTSAKIANGVIVNADIATNAAIALSKLANSVRFHTLTNVVGGVTNTYSVLIGTP